MHKEKRRESVSVQAIGNTRSTLLHFNFSVKKCSCSVETKKDVYLIETLFKTLFDFVVFQNQYTTGRSFCETRSSQVFFRRNINIWNSGFFTKNWNVSDYVDWRNVSSNHTQSTKSQHQSHTTSTYFSLGCLSSLRTLILVEFVSYPFSPLRIAFTTSFTPLRTDFSLAAI